MLKDEPRGSRKVLEACVRVTELRCRAYFGKERRKWHTDATRRHVLAMIMGVIGLSMCKSSSDPRKVQMQLRSPVLAVTLYEKRSGNSRSLERLSRSLIGDLEATVDTGFGAFFSSV